MAAFDKILSGFPKMDEILGHIRLGDNVVWQVSDIDEFRHFAEPFARQSVKDNRNMVYIRFAEHEPVLRDLDGIKVYEFDPEIGFEAFTVSIYDTITAEGLDAFYVFDCLSDLQSAWYTDLMMGNFFCVTCPYLTELDTAAYFPIIKGRHSFDAIARIRDTTQLLLDVSCSDEDVYLHPLKVWNRYSTSMFLPHCAKRVLGDFQTIKDGIGMSRYYHVLHQSEQTAQDQNIDSHDRFFSAAKAEYAQGSFTSETEDLILKSCMTKDGQMMKLLKQYFTPKDYFSLSERIIGSGAIGGKACGMLLARKIAETDIPEYNENCEPHDSFYIGSDVFYTYVVSNDCWKLRIKQRTKEGYFSVADELKEKLLKGTFPSQIREQFRKMLDYYGQIPIIVRSSSFLEDGFGNAFAGKYESVFCVNRSSPEERIEDFEQAVRVVYASTMDVSALEYRRQRGLDNHDEQMAILVQRVSGSYYDDYFMPSAAGVGYSHSAYKWSQDMDCNAGMLRIVMGLGTKAVDRTANDYPRLANLDRPAASVMTTAAQKHRFSQKQIDVIDFKENTMHGVSLDALTPSLPRWYINTILEHDYEAENTLLQMGRYREVYFVSCQGLLENRKFTGLMQQILQTLQRVYGNPVDIEYTVNIDEINNFVVNLLQCRPLYVSGNSKKLELPSLSKERVFFDIQDSSMGSSTVKIIDIVIQIDPVAYYNYPYVKKYEVTSAVRKINQYCQTEGKQAILMTPGRIGTSSPELGVPVTFADISNFCGICEVSDSRAGYMPELSYGSHMFQDLVEAEIFYGAIWENENTLHYNPELFKDLEDIFTKICPDTNELSKLFRVTEPENLYYWMDAITNHGICGYPVI